MEKNELKEIYKKQIEMLLLPLDIRLHYNGGENLKRFKQESENPHFEIKEFYKKTNSSYDEKTLDEAIEELIPFLYMFDN